MHILARVYATTMFPEIMFATIHCSCACVTRILETLETCVNKGQKDTAPVWNRKRKAEWWGDLDKYVIYASTNGSLRAVKYFIDRGQIPHSRYVKLFRIL